MYKVLLADDEGIELDALNFIINKDFIGKCTVRNAKTGREAIEIAESFRPDIAVMDIRMPGINGIDAMREIQTFLPNVLFIVLTAYDRFEYAKEAVNLSAFEFLTKPVSRVTFSNTLQHAMDKADSERLARNNALQARERIENMLPVLENSFVYMLISQSEDPEAYMRMCRLLGIDAAYATAMVLEITGASDEDMLDTDMKVSDEYEAIRGLIKDAFESIVGSAMANRVVFVRPCDKPEDEYHERLMLIEQGRTLAHRIEGKLGIRCRLGIGSTVEMQSLCESYGQAVKAVKNCKGIVSHYNDLPIASVVEDGYPLDREKRLEEAVLAGDVTAAVQHAELFFQWMIDSYPEHDMVIRLKVLEFVMRAELNVFNKAGGSSYRFLDRNDYLQTVLAASDYAVLKIWFLRKIAESARSVASGVEQKSNGTVQQAVQFIDKNYFRALTLEGVSREVSVSPYYFSKLFKEQMSMNYIEYLTQKRIEAAKLLLRDRRYNIKQICSKIGYSDSNYFSRLFHKTEGVTPTEYREQYWKGENL